MSQPTAPPNANDDIPVQPGAVLAGKYRVSRVLGKGGMGIVVEARHIHLDERVALKFLLPEYAQHAEASARFLREGQAAVKIKGEHVARVSDVGTLETGSPYMVMEFLEGIDLAKALQTYGVCQIPDAIDYTLQACEAIAEAHALGIVHRDLKPANLFLTRRPDGTPMIKVLDFGISKMSGGGVDNLTRTTATMGSALYMSPEQMQATRGVDHRTDVYALGISLYELLAGKQPYFADTLPQLCAEVLTGTPTPIHSLRHDVPDGLARALEKAYARDREQRYQTIAELAAGLAPFAPSRSQTSLDRIARMAGLQPSLAGASAHPGHPASAAQAHSPPAPAGLTQSGLAQSGAAPAAGAMAQSTPAVMTQSAPAVMAQAQTGVPGQQAGGFGPPATPSPSPIAIGGYQGPMSTKAAAAFAAGASTNTSLSSTSGVGAAAPPRKVGVAIAAVAIGLALVAGGAVALLRIKGQNTQSAPGPDVSAPAQVPSASASATTGPVTTASTAKAAEPATSATEPDPAAPAATGSAEAAPSASAPATTAPKVVAPTATAKPKPTAKPIATQVKKPGVMTSR